MAADINSFVEDVVREACILLQIQDTVTNLIATFDSRVNVCARSAYSQIVSFLNRELVFGSYKERYFDQDTRILLRNCPIKKVDKVTIIDNEYASTLSDSFTTFDLIDTTEYLVQNNKYLMLNVAVVRERNTAIKDVHSPISIYVEYDGGYLSLEEQEPRIFEALILQTVANYNRLSILGVSEMSTSSGKVLMSSVGNSLVESASLVLQPFVYYGAAE